ncbi:MAG: ABC transporter permease [Gemmatimonadaceae bacterium]
MPNATPRSVAAYAETAPGDVGPDVPPASRLLATLLQDRTMLVAVAVLLVIALGALLAPWVTRYDPSQQFDVARLLLPPSADHWFGTDPLSRDVFSRVVYGARVSLAVALLAMSLSIGIGTVYGAVAGYAGGTLDATMMRSLDALLSIPRVLLLLGVLSLWGQLSTKSLVVLIGVTGWFGVARLVRAQVLALREREFVAASRALGARRWRILVRHILPHVSSPVLVAATLGIGNVIIVEAGLSFLGYGVPVPQPSWGSILRDAHPYLNTQIGWWLTVFPGLALVITVLAVNVLSDRLRAAMNPRQLPAS